MLIKTTLQAYELQTLVVGVSRGCYAGNVFADRCEDIGTARGGANKIRFTLATENAWARGSRTSASGRHMRAASWEAHRDILAALFDADPAAIVETAFAKYVGKAGFERDFPATGDHNVGSQYQPVSIRETSV